MGNGKSLGAGRNLQGVTQRRKEVSVKNGNGKQDLSAVATLEGRLELRPEEIRPVVHRETAIPHSDRFSGDRETVAGGLGSGRRQSTLSRNAGKSGAILSRVYERVLCETRNHLENVSV